MASSKVLAFYCYNVHLWMNYGCASFHNFWKPLSRFFGRFSWLHRERGLHPIFFLIFQLFFARIVRAQIHLCFVVALRDAFTVLWVIGMYNGPIWWWNSARLYWVITFVIMIIDKHTVSDHVLLYYGCKPDQWKWLWTRVHSIVTIPGLTEQQTENMD